MTFKPATWYPIAILLSLGNLVAVGFAAATGEAMHATIHGVLALSFGVWAYRLRQDPGGSDFEGRFDALDAEVNKLRQELSEAQERLDFAERLLAQGPEARRVDPHRGSS